MARRTPGIAAGATREEVVARAATSIAAGRGVDVRALAQASGVGRTTLYRWFGGRAGLLSEALWWLFDRAWHDARASAGGAGPEYVLGVFRLFLGQVSRSRAADTLLVSEPRQALVAVMSPTSAVQRRAVVRTLQLLQGHTDLSEAEARDVAEVVTQVSMTTAWALVLAEAPPDVAAAMAICRRLIL